MLMQHEDDPKTRVLDEIGDISDIEWTGTQVVVALYKRPEATRGGIILPEASRDEDIYQGKVGLIVATGPDAFNDPSGKWSWPDSIDAGSWVMFRASDGWRVDLLGKGKNKRYECRVLADTSIRAVVPNPEAAW
jgi:co-chaperonin GroES (HSP10)